MNRADGLLQWTLGRIASRLVQGPGIVTYGASQGRFLFDGEDEGGAIDLAVLMAQVRRESARVVRSADIVIAADVLARHHARFFTADPRDRYVLNYSGPALVRGKAAPAQEEAGDTVSLRQYRGHLFYPANLLYRMDLRDPRAALHFADSVRIAAGRLLSRPAVQSHEVLRRDATSLLEAATDIRSIEDPRLARLVEEQLLHNIMAHRALGRQKRCQGGDLLIRITDLPEEALAAYLRGLSAPEEAPEAVVIESTFMSTSLSAERANMFSRRHKKYKFIVRSLGCGSLGRHLDGSVEGVWSGEEEVVFPPGSAFRVTRLEEDVADDCTDGGEPRTYLFLQEISSAAVSAQERRLTTQARPEELFVHGLCTELPRIIQGAALDLAYAFADQRVPAVVLSRRPHWDATATALASPGPCVPPLDQAGFTARGEGLFRIAIEPSPRMLPWSEFVAAFNLTSDEVRELEATGERVGSSLDDCWLALEPVERPAWRRLEVWQEGFEDWIEVELPAILPCAAGRRQRKRRTGAMPQRPPLDLSELAPRVHEVLESTYKQPFKESYVHPRTGEVIPVRYSPFVEPLRSEVPRWTHGAMHAARTTLWGLLMSELYRCYTGEVEANLHDLLLAMTHHDCAREDEGADLWDEQSGARVGAYLRARGDLDAPSCRYFADAVAGKEKRDTLARQMVQAADCLDILRVSVFLAPLRIQRGWAPRGGFNSDQLDLYRVISDADGEPAAAALLGEIHHFIRLTEVPEIRVWFETRVTSFLLELLGALTRVHEHHGCYPELCRWLAPFLEQVPADHPTAVVSDLLEAYFERITAAGVSPVQVKADMPWESLWDQSRWRIRVRPTDSRPTPRPGTSRDH